MNIRELRRQEKPGSGWRHIAAAALVAGLATPVAHAAESELDDTEILQAIEDELLFSSYVPTDDIDITVTDGVATLSGEVDTLLGRERAIAFAQSVKGVRSVVDQMEVAAPEREDAGVQVDVRDALLQDPATDAWELDVDVNDGIATLRGTVQSYAEKELAATVAKGVHGVRGIENEIEFEFGTERADSEIALDIEQRLRWDVRVDDALIDVTVEDGNVTLSGAVGSAFEKTVAQGDAWVAGVRRIDAEGLEVRWYARDEMQRVAFETEVADAEIERAVEDGMLFDPRVSSFEVDADVELGVVTLSGVVDNLKAKRAAAQTASNTVGVSDVRNHVKVRPVETVADAQLERWVEDALARDPVVESFEIDVTATDGEIRLYGDVDSYFERSQAADVVARVSGVQRIHNYLKVDYSRPDGFVLYEDWDPRLYGYAFDFETVRTRGDDEIEREIESELTWSPFVDADQVDVSVSDGVAILTGTVDSWLERRKAGENAIEGGAIEVRNRLDVSDS